MKVIARWVVILAVAGIAAIGISKRANAVVNEELAVLNDPYAAEQRAAEEARGKDPAWKATAEEQTPLQLGDASAPGALKSYCLDKDGNILAAFTTPSGSAVKIYTPEGKLTKTLPLPISPGAIAMAKSGEILVAGDGKVVKLDREGKVLAEGKSPSAGEAVVITDEFKEMVKETAQQNRRSFEEELASMKTMLENRRTQVTGVAATEKDVFMAVPSPSDFTFRVYRFDLALKEPKLVVEKLRGCCGQMDVQAHEGNMWIAHNARHAVENIDREGKQIAKFGKAGKVKPSDFGGCCEPKCMRILASGDILVAESGPPTCIKRFSAKGEFKEVVAIANGTKGDCVRVTVEMSPDGKRYYMLDTTKDAIRVFIPRTLAAK